MNRPKKSPLTISKRTAPPAAASPPAGWRRRRATPARELRIHGRGLHTGRAATVRILPVDAQAAGQGIVFRRIEEGRVLAEAPVSPDVWRKELFCSTLQVQNDLKVRTVEHLLAALLLCQIDDAIVELDAEEIPFLDGAATAWVEAIKACGRTHLPKPKRFIRVLRPFRKIFHGSPESRYVIGPANDYRLVCTVDEAGFPRSRWTGRLTPARFAKAIAPARSYGHLKWVLPALLAGCLRHIPVLRGARPGTLIGLVAGHAIGGLRFPNEFARHRVLDLIGDFALAGAPLLARVKAVNPTHYSNVRFIKALLARPHLWEWAEFPSKAVADPPKLV